MADMYRWVDAKGVVNYSNVPPPATTGATRIADTEPTVSVIPPRERTPESQAAREAREAALVRRIGQLEDEIAQLKRAAAQPPVYAAYPVPPAATYAEYAWPIAYPVYPWPIRPGRPHYPGFRPGHGKHPVAVPHGARGGIAVRIGR